MVWFVFMNGKKQTGIYRFEVISRCLQAGVVQNLTRARVPGFHPLLVTCH
jgi:hypothetical protein